MKYYYLDNAATTPLSKEALQAMLPYLTEDYGNASTIYTLGQRAKRAVEESRRTIAETIGAHPSEIYFTSGGTESDNWALIGGAELGQGQLQRTSAAQAKGTSESSSSEADGSSSSHPVGHIITDVIEHHAILHTCEYLEKRGFDVTYLPVDAEGHVDPDAVMAALRPDTVLVSVMAANNEIGTLEPIAEIGKRLKEYENAHGQRILFHTDAVQAYGHIPLNVDALQVDLLSTSSHKLNGPKGIGFLYIRRGVKLPSFLHGGEQERGRRAGTENVAGMVGFARAAEIACAEMDARRARETTVRDHLIARLLAEIPFTTLNGDPVHRLPNNVNVCFKYIEGETLLLLLNEKHIYASSGSACASGSLDPSHVLTAIGVSHEDAYGSLRLTLSPETTMQDVNEVVELLKPIVAYLREQSPLYKKLSL
ncbi:MAG TPA: cysteine desulfurase NifS [Oribacterium sp.]|nr:cysteine desulfurase NifS [Oribacterium sp.]